MNVGEIWAALRVDGAQAKTDVTKAATAAGAEGGKTLGARFKESFTKEKVGKGLIQGMGLGAGLGIMNLAASGIQAVAGAISDSVDAAKDFDSQLRTINTVANVTDEQLARIGDRIQDLSVETGKTTDELTAGFYDLVSAGIPAEHAMQVLKDSAVLATGALGTTGEAVDLITSSLNAYGMEATESTRLTDIFAAAVRDGKVTAAELGSSIANIAPIAASAGIAIEEVAAGYAQLTKNGVPAAQAATQMRQAISALLTPNAELARIQKELNVNFAEMAASDGLAKALDVLRSAAGSEEAFAKSLGSVEALGFALLTTGENAGAFGDELAAVEKAALDGGVALGQYEEQAKGAAAQDAKRAAQVKTLSQDFGKLMMPLARALEDGAIAAVAAIRSLGDIYNKFLRTIDKDFARRQDEDNAIREVAEAWGVEEGALRANIDAQRDAQQAIGDTDEFVKKLQDRLNISDNTEKDTVIAGLTADLEKFAKEGGVPLNEVLDTALDNLANFDIRVEGTGRLLAFLATQFGLVTYETDEYTDSIEWAKEKTLEYLNEGIGATPEAAAAAEAFWYRQAEAAKGGTEAIVEEVKHGRERTALEWHNMRLATAREIEQGMDDAVAAISIGVVDMRDKIKNGKAAIIEQARDLAWQLKHPYAQVNYGNWILKQIDETNEKIKRAEAAHMPGRVAQLKASLQLMKEEIWSIPRVAAAAARATIRWLGSIAAAVNRMPALAAIPGLPFAGFLDVQGIPGAASGGYRSGRTLVGERGMEIVDLPQGSYVHDNEESQRMLAGGGDVHLYVHTDDGQTMDLSAQLQRALQGASDSAHIRYMNAVGA